MTRLLTQIDGDDIVVNGPTEAIGESYDGNATARICNAAAENGYEQIPGPLTWLNSARVTTDPADDAVHCAVSIGDPRGAFVMTVRRTPDGRILIHVPHPSDEMAHMETREIRPGTLEIVTERGGDRPLICRDEYPDGDHELPSGAVVTFASGRPVSVDLQGEDRDDAVSEIRRECGFVVTIAGSGPNPFVVLTSEPVA